MSVKGHSIKHRLKRNHTVGHRRSRLAAPYSPTPWRAPRDAQDLELLAACQDQNAELAQTILGLRERLQDRDTTVAELRQSRAYFQELFDFGPAGYLVHEAAGRIAACNRVAATLLGLKGRHHPDASILQFIPQSELAGWLSHIRQCVATRQCATVELHLRDRRDHALPVQLFTVPNPALPSVAPTRFYTVFFDVSEHRQTEAALARSREDYQRLIDTIEGIVWKADARTLNFTFVSGYAERLLGYPLSEWKRPGAWGSHVYVEDRDRVTNRVARAVGRREALCLEYRVLTASRQLLWLHDSMTVAEHGGELRLMGVAVDITRRRQAEEEARQARERLEQRVAERTATLRERVRELEAISYSMPHDLRAPLRAMAGFAEMGLDYGGEQLAPEVKDCFQRILDSAHRGDQLVRDILSYSQVSRANITLEPIDIERLLAQLTAQYREFQPPQARVRVRGPLLPVLGQEACLAQALTNLLSNAVKFVRPGTRPCVTVRTERVGRQVRIWVEDNGIGIAPAHRSRIFRMFERLHPVEEYAGTGIGLAIVRKSVERMGGSIGVESAPDRGSKFWMQLHGVEQ